MRFDACAHAYDQYARPQRLFAARVADFARIAAGSEVLELGAGTGALTRHLCGIPGVQVRATDASVSMLQLGAAHVPDAQWFALDAFQAAIPQAAVQVSSGLLQWAEEPVETLKRWRTGLRHGGRMIHAFPCEPCLHEWRSIIQETPLHWRSEEEWLRLFACAGLQIQRKELWIEQCLFTSAFEMVRGLHRSGVTGAPQVAFGRLRRGIRDYDARYRTPEGVKATWAWLVIEAGPHI